ncbi:predicted protein [Chaetomium globosum CBS 148.51]|uniref:Uncharacterized protein n=1 Tax=Chaetomium globosum (strain ATCC 6205 / CBS 148.51 / DSM 1962 / NBRC 6347 / NRRL 1970) TaxID=306901 RepID=Q2HC43_CHAGB|nr:uncharacterized protein CHGG_02211 [Chaetomium globosum CBS 148.51]EAQ90276.1 predicted protein [Chaetomium globosum CBS 148.51]
MTMPEGEAAKVLGIAAAGAGGAISPQLEHVDASEMMESRDALLQAIRDIDVRLAKLEVADSGSADYIIARRI